MIEKIIPFLKTLSPQRLQELAETAQKLGKEQGSSVVEQGISQLGKFKQLLKNSKQAKNMAKKSLDIGAIAAVISKIPGGKEILGLSGLAAGTVGFNMFNGFKTALKMRPS